MKIVVRRVENIVGKEENNGYQQADDTEMWLLKDFYPFTKKKTNKQNLDRSKFEEFADDKINVTENLNLFLEG